MNKQRLIFLFFVGAVALNYPLLSIADTDQMLLGIPVLYLYLFVVWALLIGGCAAVVARMPDPSDSIDG
jgi:hypothetical protein